MAVRKVCQLPDDVLKRKSKKVPSIDSSIKNLIDDMVETMQVENGVGLAAPQIGVSLQIAVLQMPKEGPFAIINPKVVKRSGEREVV